MHRPYADVRAEMLRALEGEDREAMKDLAAELDVIATAEAAALSGRARGYLHILQGEYDEAIRVFEQAESDARSFAPSPDLGFILSSKGQAQVWSGLADEAERTQQEALDIFTQQDNAIGMSRALIRLGLVHEYRGAWRDGLVTFERALHVAQDHQIMAVVASAETNIAIMHFNLHRYEDAIEFARRGLEHHQALGRHADAGRALGVLGNAHHQLGHMAEALDAHIRSLDLVEQAHDVRQLPYVLQNIGTIYAVMHDYARALDYLERSLELATRYRADRLRAFNLVNIGKTSRLTGDRDKALRLLTEAIHWCTEHRFDEVLGYALASLATLRIQDGDLVQADELIQRALALTTGLEGVRIRPHILTPLAELLWEEGKVVNVRATLDEIDELGNQEPDLAMRISALRKKLAIHDNDLQEYVYWSEKHLELVGAGSGPETQQRMADMMAMHHIREERREHQRHLDLLRAVLPTEVVERMMRGETVSGDHFEGASVLFADIAGFTSHAAQLQPEEVVNILGVLFRCFDDLCSLHGITKLKTMGDSYICYKVDGTEQENVVAIAEMALAMQRHGTTWPSGEPLSLRIGIHVGPVAAGVIGTKQLQYDIWGDTVNVASRMESTSETGRIQVSEAFAQALTRAEESRGEQKESDESVGLLSLVSGLRPLVSGLRERGSVEVKGKGIMMTYWLEGA